MLRDVLTSRSPSLSSNSSSSNWAKELMSIFRSSVVRLADSDPSKDCEL